MEKIKIVVLGAGLVGGPMAIDLAKDNKYFVSLVDRSQDTLNLVKEKNPEINTIQKDLSNPESVTELVSHFDYVINAVPGFMGFETAKAIIKAKKHCVDIAFYPEDAFQLDALAKENNVTMIMDCGVCPGMGGILLMHASTLLDEMETGIIYVGGLPVVREWPFEYKAVFSPIDVIEEYLRPARIIENNQMVVRPALSEPELMNFPGVGTLEAFNTDGLRSLATTIRAKNLKEKTLRYPGHIEKMRMLRELGFLSYEQNMEINGVKIRPIDFTSKLLFPNWKLKKGEADLTIFQVIASGVKNGKNRTYTWDMLDKYDPETDTISMARTTGYTATVALRMVIDGVYTHKGISPSEYIGKNADCMKYLLDGLKQRNVIYKESVIE